MGSQNFVNLVMDDISSLSKILDVPELFNTRVQNPQDLEVILWLTDNILHKERATDDSKLENLYNKSQDYYLRLIEHVLAPYI